MKILKILLIDDQDISLFVSQHIISASGKRIQTTLQPSGFSALNFLKNNINNPHVLPDIILLDVDMPVIDGMDFLDEFSKLLPHFNVNIFVFILSAFEINPMIASYVHRGIVKDYFVKPLSLSKLNALISQIDS